MAMTVTADFTHDIVEVLEDLEAVEEGLGRILGDVIVREMKPVIAEMKRLLPRDPAHRGWRGWNSSWRAPRDPGHIRESLVAEVMRNRGARVRTTHPGGPVWWWGGSIAPSGHVITIRKHSQAGEDFTLRQADEIGQKIEDAIDRLLLILGF